MAQAYDAIIATITVASDASQVVKAMVKSTEWREGTSGSWLTTDCTLNPSTTYQFRTPLSGMDSTPIAILPNIKASVTVDWDTTATPISTLGDFFMMGYAFGCSNLTSLSVPDTSGITSVGDFFMMGYAYDCSSLTSLSVPDTSGLTSVGDYFMGGYAEGCSGLTSLSVPDTSGLTSVGDYFMNYYASYCTSLTSLSVPDTSSVTSVGNGFMYYYAYRCSSLTSLGVPDTSSVTSAGGSFMGGYAYDCSKLTSLILPAVGWFATHDIDWSVPSGRLGYLKGSVIKSSDLSDWKGLTTSGKTLYINYIRSADDVILPEPPETPVVGEKYALPPFRRA